MALDWKHTQDGISRFASASSDGVICSESCDDPHGPNSESRCTAQAWIARDEDGERCRRMVLADFGPDAVAQIDAALRR